MIFLVMWIWTYGASFPPAGKERGGFEWRKGCLKVLLQPLRLGTSFSRVRRF